jgi:hypothetical protein
LKLEVIAQLRKNLPNSTISDEQVERILDGHVIPPLSSLAEGGVTELRRPDVTGGGKPSNRSKKKAG